MKLSKISLSTVEYKTEYIMANIQKRHIQNIIKFGLAGFAKVLSAIVGFMATVLITRNMSGDEAGSFLLGLTLVTILHVILRLGLSNVVLRLLSSGQDYEIAQGKLNRSLIWVSTATIPVFLCFFFGADMIASGVFNKPEFGPTLKWISPAIPMMSIYFLLSSAFQSQERVVLTTFFQNLGGMSLFILCFIGLGYFRVVDSFSAELASKTFSAATLIICILAVTLWFCQAKNRFTFHGYRDRELAASSIHLWLASCMGICLQWSGVLVAGALVTSTEVAYLSAAQRTAMLISFVLMIVNIIMAPRYSRMWANRQLTQMTKTSKMASRLMVILVLPLVTLALLIPEKIMALFGSGYEEAAILFSILVLGQFINVATGSVGWLLMMTGHEKEYNISSVISSCLTIILSVVLTMQFGVIGAAIATAIGVSIQNIISIFIVKSRLGFFPI